MSTKRAVVVAVIAMMLVVAGVVGYAVAEDGDVLAQVPPPANPGAMGGRPPMGGPGMGGPGMPMMGPMPVMSGPQMQVGEGSVYILAGPNVYRLDGKTLELKAEWEMPHPEPPRPQ